MQQQPVFGMQNGNTAGAFGSMSSIPALQGGGNSAPFGESAHPPLCMYVCIHIKGPAYETSCIAAHNILLAMNEYRMVLCRATRDCSCVWVSGCADVWRSSAGRRRHDARSCHRLWGS